MKVDLQLCHSSMPKKTNKLYMKIWMFCDMYL